MALAPQRTGRRMRASRAELRDAPPGHFEVFAARDWGLLAAAATMWGSSFLFIEIGLEGLAPEVVAVLRLVFGAATLAAIPRARRAVPRSDLPAIALLGVVWMAIPFLLFAFAQERIDSSLAGMLNGAVPLFTVVIAAVLVGRAPGRRQLAGLAIGFVGVVAIGLPALRGAEATALGAGMILLAVLLYGIAINLSVPLERRHGALPVLLRAQLFALLLVSPLGLANASDSSFGWASIAAVAALGCLGTGLAFVAFVTLVGRVGAARGSVAIYFIPAVAIVLGVVFREESVAVSALVGTALVTLGAYLTSRREERADGPGDVDRDPPVPAA